MTSETTAFLLMGSFFKIKAPF